MTIDLGCVGKQLEPVVETYDWRDVALYAIGLGAGTDDLGYLLEPTPKVLPTYGVVPSLRPVVNAMDMTKGDVVNLLHSAQRTEQIKPFPSAGEMRTIATIEGIWDMKIGALAKVETRTTVNGELTATTNWDLLLRGEGGFGGPKPPKSLRTKPPAGQEPAFRVEVPTNENQALLYRLCGDLNPIHSNPEVAKQAGFDRPILHGLCFYGVGARIALRELAGDDPGRFKSFNARFAKIVMPGDTLIVEGWPLEEVGKAAITVTIKENGNKAIANGLFEYTV